MLNNSRARAGSLANPPLHRAARRYHMSPDEIRAARRGDGRNLENLIDVWAAARLEPPMNKERAVAVRVVPQLEGMDEIEDALSKVSDAVLYARNLLDRVKTMTVEVTAFTELEDATDSR